MPPPRLRSSSSSSSSAKGLATAAQAATHREPRRHRQVELRTQVARVASIIEAGRACEGVWRDGSGAGGGAGAGAGRTVLLLWVTSGSISAARRDLHGAYVRHCGGLAARRTPTPPVRTRTAAGAAKAPRGIRPSCQQQRPDRAESDATAATGPTGRTRVIELAHNTRPSNKQPSAGYSRLN